MQIIDSPVGEETGPGLADKIYDKMKQHQEKRYFRDKFKPHEKRILSSIPWTLSSLVYVGPE